MTKYQLAKLIQWTGPLETRKRMQKVVYLLQTAGCPFEADFFLHRFGPYSHEVARVTEELVSAGVLEETQSENTAGRQYGYRLSERGQALLTSFEAQTKVSKPFRQRMSPFRNLAKRLAKHGVRELEVASTIAYFYTSEGDWNRAKERACVFKNVPPKTEFASRVEALARSVAQ